MAAEAILDTHVASSTPDEDDLDDFCIKIIDNDTGDVSIISACDLSDDCIIVEDEQVEPEQSVARKSPVANNCQRSVVAPTHIYRNVALRRDRLPAKVNTDQRSSASKSILRVHPCSRCRVEFKELSERDEHEAVCRFDRPPSYHCDEYYSPPIPTHGRPKFFAAMGLVSSYPASTVIRPTDVPRVCTTSSAANCRTTANTVTSTLIPPASESNITFTKQAAVATLDSGKVFVASEISAQDGEIRECDCATVEVTKSVEHCCVSDNKDNTPVINTHRLNVESSRSDSTPCGTKPASSHSTTELNKMSGLVRLDAGIMDVSNSSSSLSVCDSNDNGVKCISDESLLQTPRRMRLSRCSLASTELIIKAEDGKTSNRVSERLKLKTLLGSKSLLAIDLSSTLGRRIYRHTVAQLSQSVYHDPSGKNNNKVKYEKNRKAPVTSVLKILNPEDRRRVVSPKDSCVEGVQPNVIVGNIKNSENVRDGSLNKENFNFCAQRDVMELHEMEVTHRTKDTNISLHDCDDIDVKNELPNDTSTFTCLNNSVRDQGSHSGSSESEVNTPCTHQDTLTSSPAETNGTVTNTDLSDPFPCEINQCASKSKLSTACQENATEISECKIEPKNRDLCLRNTSERFGDITYDSEYHKPHLDCSLVDSLQCEVDQSTSKSNVHTVCRGSAMEVRECKIEPTINDQCNSSVKSFNNRNSSEYHRLHLDHNIVDASIKLLPVHEEIDDSTRIPESQPCHTSENSHNLMSRESSITGSSHNEISLTETWTPPAYEEYCCSTDKCIFRYRLSRHENESLPFTDCRHYKCDTARSNTLDSSLYSNSTSEYCHIYKFTRTERQTFCKAISQGLNCRSYFFKESLVPAYVLVKKLTSREIENWKSSVRLRLDNRRFRISRLRLSELRLFRSVADSTRNSEVKQNGRYNTKSRKEPSRKVERKVVSRSKATRINKNYSSKNAESQMVAVAKSNVRNAKKNDQKIEKKAGRKVTNMKVKSKMNPIIAISSDEERDDDVMCVSMSKTNEQPHFNIDSVTSLVSSVTFMLRCHVCGADITCSSSSRDKIKEHYKSVHNIHNVELIRSKNSSGKDVLTIVQSAPSVKPLPNPIKSAKSSQPSQRHNHISNNIRKRKLSSSKQASSPSVSQPIFDSRTSTAASSVLIDGVEDSNNSLLSNLATILLDLQNARNSTDIAGQVSKPVKSSRRASSSGLVNPSSAASRRDSVDCSFLPVSSFNRSTANGNRVILQKNSEITAVKREGVASVDTEIICLD